MCTSDGAFNIFEAFVSRLNLGVWYFSCIKSKQRTSIFLGHSSVNSYDVITIIVVSVE